MKRRFRGAPTRLKCSAKQRQWLESFAMDLYFDLEGGYGGFKSLRSVLASIYLTGLQHGSEMSKETQALSVPIDNLVGDDPKG